MSLQLTHEEYDRFYRHLKAVNLRSANNPKKRGPEKDKEIVEKVLEGGSIEEIKREFRVSEQSIYLIRRRYGIWGV